MINVHHIRESARTIRVQSGMLEVAIVNDQNFETAKAALVAMEYELRTLRSRLIPSND